MGVKTGSNFEGVREGVSETARPHPGARTRRPSPMEMGEGYGIEIQFSAPLLPFPWEKGPGVEGAIGLQKPNPILCSPSPISMGEGAGG